MPSEPTVHVRWATTRALTAGERDLLDEAELARLARFARSADRDRFVLGAALVRHLVADLDDADPAAVALDRTCPWCGEQHGPVTTPRRPWQVSVAHSGEFAVAAAAAVDVASAVGVDVETKLPDDWKDLLDLVVAPDETPPRDEAAFLALWVRKEAVLKATREGLARPMSTVDLAAPPAGLQVIDLDLPVAPAALAVGLFRPGRARFEVRQWSPRPDTTPWRRP